MDNYNRLITIQQQNNTADTDGGYSQNWTEHCKAYAIIEPISGRELSQAAATESIYTHRIRMRAVKGVEPSMRVKFVDHLEGKTRYFNIIFCRNVGTENRELQLTCEERSYEQ
jgi:SPP1 family predicted phage head-tail adaptor